MSACTRQRTLPETHYGDTGTTPSKVVRCVLNADHVGYHVDEDGLPFGPWIETSVPPTQSPAAPETDIRLTEAIERGLRKCRVEDAPVPLIKEHDLFHVTHMVAVELAPLLAERVRVVEGERDDLMALAVEDTRRRGEALARAESAEAAHAALVAAVEALAERYDEYGAQREAAGRPAWPNNVARDLRALLAGAR